MTELGKLYGDLQKKWAEVNVCLEERLRFLVNRGDIIPDEYFKTRFNPEAMAMLRKKDPRKAFVYTIAPAMLGEVRQMVGSSKDAELKRIYAECKRVEKSLDAASSRWVADYAIEQKRTDAAYEAEHPEIAGMRFSG